MHTILRKHRDFQYRGRGEEKLLSDVEVNSKATSCCLTLVGRTSFMAVFPHELVVLLRSCGSAAHTELMLLVVPQSQPRWSTWNSELTCRTLIKIKAGASVLSWLHFARGHRE